MSSAIVANALSKRYLIPTAPDGVLDALRDVSFDIDEGEAVGLIGRNGAGKSTLLRILSRVTRPTTGFADVYGTVGALLEVGTGFHPELTGRENAFLSGAILGLTKREVAARFDEIVAFAEIEPFIDVPVKRYSSGMYARLGFAVAAHLRPSILIVDEVLAVGDLAFQARCLSHMHRLTQDGTTVLFVSHSMVSVADLCERGLFLTGGRLTFDGPVNEAIGHYRRDVGNVTDSVGGESSINIVVRGPTGARTTDPRAGLEIELAIDRPASNEPVAAIFNVIIDSSDGRTVVHARSDIEQATLHIGPGSNRFQIRISELPLAPGDYSLFVRAVSLAEATPFILDSTCLPLTVEGDVRTEAIIAPRVTFESGAMREPVNLAR